MFLCRIDRVICCFLKGRKLCHSQICFIIWYKLCKMKHEEKMSWESIAYWGHFLDLSSYLLKSQSLTLLSDCSWDFMQMKAYNPLPPFVCLAHVFDGSRIFDSDKTLKSFVFSDYVFFFHLTPSRTIWIDEESFSPEFIEFRCFYFL